MGAYPKIIEQVKKMEEKIIDIVEITGYCEVSDVSDTFKKLEVEEDAFEDLIQTLEDEFNLEISSGDASRIYSGSVKDLIIFIKKHSRTK